MALAGVLASCTPNPDPIAPSGLRALPTATAERWAGALRPAQPTRYDVRWRFTTQQGSAAGRAVVRYQGPDSLRFDYRAPFGRSGAAVFVGPAAVWAEPADELRSMVPAAPLFWAGVGLPLGPPPGARVTGEERTGTRIWRYDDAGDVMNLIWQDGTLQAEYRSGERLIGLADVQYDSTGRPVTAELRFPAQAARLTFTFEAVETVAPFGPEIWQRP